MMKQVKFLPQRMLTFIFGLILSTSAFAQQITVNGHVKDGSGEDIIGATVRIIGQDGGVVTDFDGNFTIQANQGATLSIAYIGYETATIAAAPNVEVLLKEEAAKSLNEIVVIGYGVAKKNDLTGSVTAIKPDEKNRALVTSAQELMQGKIAGVNITTSSGEPGSGATIRIRGGSSFSTSGNDPLIVIDGLAIDSKSTKGLANPLSMVNPNDIETFTVLKDASATAIYGSRGSNGVIIITTKKGRSSMPAKVSYNGNMSVAMVKKYADVLNGNEYRDLVKKYYGESSAQFNLLGNANTDWQKEIYRTAVSADHNLTVSGGLKNMPYRISAGYTDQNGILKTSNYQRVTASVNLNPSFLQDHLKFNVNGKFMYAHNRKADGGAIGDAVAFDPTQPVTSPDAKFKNFHGYWQWTQDAPFGDSAYPYSKISLAPSNPLSKLYSANNRDKAYDYQGNVEIDYQIHGFEDLRLHMNFSGEYSSGNTTSYSAPWSPANFYYGYNGFDQEEKYNLNYTAYLQYYKDFAKTQHFDLMGGYEWRHEKYWGDNNGFGLYPKSSAKAGQKYNEQSSEWKSEHYLVSFYGRMNYIAFDRYMLTATLRADGSSRFKKGNKWGYFPSVALGWRINEEAFLKNAKNLSELKLRLGWGQTGQQEGIDDYAYMATYQQPTSTQSLYPTFGKGYQYIPNPYNTDLKWETTTTYNAGLDFGFFRNRVTGSIDVYHRKTTDLLMTAPVESMSSFSNTLTKNVGSLENTGVEASLTVRPIQTTNWQWEITANATYNKNKVTALAGDGQPIKYGNVGLGIGTPGMCHQVGRPMGSFWVYQQAYDKNGKILQGVVVDRNADGYIDDKDRYYYKSATAPWLFGFSSRLQYKNWDFGFGLRANVGNYVFNKNKLGYRSPLFVGTGSGYLANTMRYAFDTDFLIGSSQQYEALTDYFVENASFLKCDNITLGHSFNNLFKGGSYNGLAGRIYLTASNVFTISNYDGLDPEVNGGIDGNIYPRPLSFVMGLSLNF